ncbi:MAG TPA: hypothetical protein VLH56_07410 [Dissulfurispiraceae bacterium]|nr:hypothetical protein [Dissulfurispiraceae bacterium]
MAETPLQTDLATKDKTQRIVVADEGPLSVFLDTGKYEQTWRAARTLAASNLVPVQYQNKPENCFLAFTMAQQVGMNPFAFMQKTYMVGGKLAMEAQLIIALLNTRGPFKDPVQWEFTGEGKERACTAYATHKVTGSRCEATVTWAMVEGEKWHQKERGVSKWLTMPDMMFRYRSASFLASLYCPEVKFGMMTLEEAEDIDGVTVVSPTKPAPPVSPLDAKLHRKAVTSEVVGTTTQNVAQLESRLLALAREGHYLCRSEDGDFVLGKVPAGEAAECAEKSLQALTTKDVDELTAADVAAINVTITEVTKGV